MVRVIFFALLLANLLFPAWAEWIDTPPPPPPSPIAGLPRLTLVSELPADKRAALASKMAVETPAPPQCVSVGPFDDPAIAARAAALLQAKSFTPRQRIAQSPAIRRFWVHLDDFASDAAVTRVLHRLERAGIDDAEAMPADAGGRRVSLGLFTDHDRAERRVQLVRTMGLKPAITERVLPGTVYWLDLTLPNGSVPVPLKDVSDLEPGGGSAPVSAQACPSAVSPAAPSPQTEPPAPPPVPANVAPASPGSQGTGTAPALQAPSRPPGARADPPVP